MKDTLALRKGAYFSKRPSYVLKGSVVCKSLLPITRQNTHRHIALADPKAVVGVPLSQPPLKLINESLSPTIYQYPKSLSIPKFSSHISMRAEI